MLLASSMENETKIVPTKASQLKKQNEIDVVAFMRKKKTVSKSPKPVKKNVTEEEFNVKSATKEIIKVGTRGFFKFKRDKTLKTLTIELGAKPEKNRYRNYKRFKELKKVQLEKREQRLAMLKESSNLSSLNHFSRKYAKKTQKKKELNILNKYGNVK